MSLNFKHLHSTLTSFDSYNSLCFEIIDKANSKFDLKIKEALHIKWRKPNLNAPQNHLALTLSLLQLLSPLLFSVFVCLFFLWRQLSASFPVFSFTSSYYKHLVSHFSVSSIVFIISRFFNNYVTIIYPKQLL